jgi:thioredoxin 1
MQFQVKIRELPNGSYKKACVGAVWGERYGLDDLNRPLVDAIQAATSPAELARLRKLKAVADQNAKDVRLSVKNTSADRCSELLQWRCRYVRASWCAVVEASDQNLPMGPGTHREGELSSDGRLAKLKASVSHLAGSRLLMAAGFHKNPAPNGWFGKHFIGLDGGQTVEVTVTSKEFSPALAILTPNAEFFTTEAKKTCPSACSVVRQTDYGELTEVCPVQIAKEDRYYEGDPHIYQVVARSASAVTVRFTARNVGGYFFLPTSKELNQPGKYRIKVEKITEKNALYLTLDNFENQVLESDVPWLVKFCNRGSDLCAVMDVVFESLSTKYGARLKLGTVDPQRQPELAELFDAKRVRVPVLVYFHGGDGYGVPFPKDHDFQSRRVEKYLIKFMRNFSAK